MTTVARLVCGVIAVAALLSGCGCEFDSRPYSEIPPDNLVCINGHDQPPNDIVRNPDFVCDTYAPKPSSS